MEKKNVVLLGFFDEQERVMLNQRLGAAEEIWGLVGGGIEDGETPMDAILREMQEELNYRMDVEHDELQLIEKVTLENDELSADIHYFVARFPGFERFGDSDEVLIRDLRMVSVGERQLLKLMPMTRHILER